MIESPILGGRIQSAGGEEIFRIAGGCCHQCTGVDIIIAVFQNFQMVRRTIDIHLDADFLQIVLHRFCQNRQFHPTWISQITKAQSFSIFIHIAISIGIFPTGFVQQFLGFFYRIRIVSVSRYTAGHRFRKRPDSHFTMSAQQRIHKAFLIDSQANGLPHPVVLQNRRFHIHLSKEIPAGRTRSDLESIVFLEKRIAGIGQTIGSIHITRLQCRRHGITIGHGLHHHVVHFRLIPPIGIIFMEMNFRIGHCISHIRPSTGYVVILDALLHVNDGPIGIAQIVNQRRTRFLGVNGDGLSFCGDAVDF